MKNAIVIFKTERMEQSDKGMIMDKINSYELVSDPEKKFISVVPMDKYLIGIHGDGQDVIHEVKPSEIIAYVTTVSELESKIETIKEYLPEFVDMISNAINEIQDNVDAHANTQNPNSNFEDLLRDRMTAKQPQGPVVTVDSNLIIANIITGEVYTTSSSWLPFHLVPENQIKKYNREEISEQYQYLKEKVDTIDVFDYDNDPDGIVYLMELSRNYNTQ